MSFNNTNHILIKTIAELHKTMGFEKPKHPLFSVHRYENIQQIVLDHKVKLSTNLYQITLKINSDCKLKYGQTTYDFDEGVLSFFAPNQISIIDAENLFPPAGWLISLHPDFLMGTPLASKIRTYDFFHYSTNEALIMNEEEEKNINRIFENIEQEYQSPIDYFSQDVIVNALELLLTYANRYYNRQFITRKMAIQPLLSKVETILNDYFQNTENEKLPSVEFIADQINLSPKYLSNSLKQLTGQNLQKHIHDKLIEQAKVKLSTTNLSVAEIAYQFGFEYPQSFSKLFKAKTDESPLEFRKRFN